MSNAGVHITHCCRDHGCKYGDNDCPVATGGMEQQYPCEDCNGVKPTIISLDDFVASEIKLITEFAEKYRSLNLSDPAENPISRTQRFWHSAVFPEERYF